MIRINTPLGQGFYVSVGDRGTDVSTLQSDLNSINEININISVDGIFGSETLAAVKKLQKYVRNYYGCRTMYIDGIAGKKTWTAIFALMDNFNPKEYIS